MLYLEMVHSVQKTMTKIYQVVKLIYAYHLPAGFSLINISLFSRWKNSFLNS